MPVTLAIVLWWRHGGVRRADVSRLVPLVLLISALWIGLVFHANVRERRSEIGILRALGARAGTILRLFLTKALLMGAAGALTENQHHFLEIVRNNTERLSVLVNDLLDISRIEAGRITTVGIGAAAPVVPFSDLDNRWKNRRVEFLLVRQ